MKIGVVSDTHSQDIPEQLVRDFKGVDLIIHTGDFCTLKDYKFFSKIAEVKAVFGNMDDQTLSDRLTDKEIFTVGNITFGLFHGEGPAKKVLDSVKARFKGDKVDVVIFGHSHQPMEERINNVLYFNPGSPTDRVVAPYRSYGMIEIKDGKVLSKIIKVRD